MTRYDSMPQAYRYILEEILSDGRPVSPRGMETMEVVGHSFTLMNPELNVVTQATRKLNLSFMAAEFLWIISGSNDARLIMPYNQQIGKFAFGMPNLDTGPSYFQGAYGPKISDQLPYILETLGNDPSSRQALLTIWRERPGPSKDIPCTCLMQFFIRNNMLDMIVYMRSNDAWLGLPYDVFNFTMIQEYIASLLSVDVGFYHHHVGSLHLYKEHWDKARKVIEEPYHAIPGIISSTGLMTAPIPPETLTVFTGMSLLAESNGVTTEDVKTWLDLSGVVNNPEWYNLLQLCAYRFHKDPRLIPEQYQRLLIYQDQYLDHLANGAEDPTP